jgi:hypothetical protein
MRSKRPRKPAALAARNSRPDGGGADAPAAVSFAYFFVAPYAYFLVAP